MLENGYQPERMKALREASEAKDITTEFEAMLDEQLSTLTNFLTTSTQDYLDETIDLFGQPQPRKYYFLEIAIKNFPAYRPHNLVLLFPYIHFHMLGGYAYYGEQHLVRRCTQDEPSTCERLHLVSQPH